MTTTLARNGIVIISLLSLAAFSPGLLRWYRHRHDQTVSYDHRFRVQHLSHLVLLVHHLLVILILFSLNPFWFAPGSEGPLGPGPSYYLVVTFGLGLFAMGNILRIWAAYHMGDSFDKSVLIKSGHRLSTDGPYRIARHPIYVGNLLAEIGLGVALTSWPLVAYTILLSLPVWNYRAGVEETLLTGYFGQAYRNYCEKVGRWLPW